MTIGRKIGLCVGGVVVLCFAIGVAGLLGISTVGNRLDAVVNVTTQKIELAAQLEANIFTFRLQERGMLMYSFIDAKDPLNACRESFDKAVSSALEKIRLIRPLASTSKERELLEHAEAAVIEYRTQQMKVWALITDGKPGEAVLLDKQLLVPVGGRVVATSDALRDLEHDQNVAVAAEASSTRRLVQTIVVLALLACLPIGVLVGLVTRNSSLYLQHTAKELQRAADEVASAASQVSATSQTLAQGASEQAASLEETSSSTEEINSITRKSAEKSKNAADVMAMTAQAVTENNKKLEALTVSIARINNSSEKISKIIKTIDEIAFQTNILALNAAVEAAQAGEAGMGFSVVADEVRSLAQRCAQAARDTTDLIEESVSSSRLANDKLQEVTTGISGRSQAAREVKTLVDEINVGSQEQERGLEQISRAIAQMEQVTQKTAASAEEGASAGAQLSLQAETLRHMVHSLTIHVGANE